MKDSWTREWQKACVGSAMCFHLASRNGCMRCGGCPMLTALKHTPNKQGFAECNWLQRLLGLTHVRTDPFVVKPGVQRQNCNGTTICTHSPGEQSNARSSPRLSQAIDLRRHAQALCNCLHEADLRCQLGYQISKDFPLELLKWAIRDNSMPNKARYRAM